ncbi:MAG: glycerophosphoryl diester phosphodiesterase membrane domain-containing protein, partial [Acidobacteriota bacterium]|nr:glycerophosphoryl diester phosphodiesterase membrane domain-containing protein [Acidobacteriota bacterium]
AAANPMAIAIVGVATIVFILLLIPVGAYTIWMGMRYALALPACVVEDLKALKALRRGVELSKGSRGRIFVLALLIGAIKLGLALITQSFIFIAVFKHHGQAGPGLTVLSQVIAFFTNTFLGPIYATGITLFYYDQRVRKEGYDIEWMMQAAGLTAPAPPAAASMTGSEPGQSSGMA